MNYKFAWYPLCLIGGATVLSACNFFSPSNSTPDKINISEGGRPVSDKKAAYRWAKEHRKDLGMYKPANKTGGKSAYFTNNFIDTMQGQKGCKGLNFYITQKSDNELAILVVAVNSDGRDLTGGYTDDKGLDVQYIIGETTMRCPHNCDTKSDLYKD